MKDIERAKNELDKGGYTCVLCRGDTIYSSKKKGINPLLELIDKGCDLSEFSAADRVVGRGAAFLYVYCRVKTVYAVVMSEKSLPVLENGGVSCEYAELVPGIINRTGDGPCPMEAAVENISDPAKALEKLRETLDKLRNQK